MGNKRLYFLHITLSTPTTTPSPSLTLAVTKPPSLSYTPHPPPPRPRELRNRPPPSPTPPTHPHFENQVLPRGRYSTTWIFQGQPEDDLSLEDYTADQILMFLGKKCRPPDISL